MRNSTSKSGAMVLGRKRVDWPLQVRGGWLPQVKEFKYLRVLFRVRGRWSRRLTDGCGCWNGLLWWRESWARRQSFLIYRSVSVPILNYGPELWVVTKRMRSWIQAAKRSYLSTGLGTSWCPPGAGDGDGQGEVRLDLPAQVVAPATRIRICGRKGMSEWRILTNICVYAKKQLWCKRREFYPTNFIFIKTTLFKISFSCTV